MPLSPSQYKAVTDTGVQLILAGPGSGKTRVITEKILHLIQKGVKPENFLALTFSDKAAHEMLDRLEKQINTSDLTISTFHSFALSVLEDNVLESGLSFSSGIISRANQLVWGLKNIDTSGFEHIEVGNNAVDVIEPVVDGISAFRDELFSPGELEPYLERKKVPLQNRYKSSSHRYVLSSSGPLPRSRRVSSAIMWTCARGRKSGSEE